MSTGIADLPTPALLLDDTRFRSNIMRMQSRCRKLGVRFRPHVKTCKSIDVLERMGSPGGITVSTLAEARFFFEQGVSDLLYAVGIAPQKLDEVVAIRRAGGDLTIVMDHPETAERVSQRAMTLNVKLPCLIELDVDGDRAGVNPSSRDLLELGRVIHQSAGLELRGVMAHAGASYECDSEAALVEVAERERSLSVLAADKLREAGMPCPVVSVGSTPTAFFAENLDGVTELRAGVYVFFDLCQADLGVCEVDDIALSVLASVIGRQTERGYLLIDAGWMALSSDRGTGSQASDTGFGLVADEQGNLIPDLYVKVVNQEHGQVHSRSCQCIDFDQFPIGSRLRVLPNHACATASQFNCYRVINDQGQVFDRWPRVSGW